VTRFDAIPSATDFAGCRVKRNTSQNTTTGTLSKISFDAVRYGDSSWFNFASQPTRITVPATGYYLVGGFMEFALNSNGSRYGDIYVNNTSRICELGGGFVVNAADNPQCVGNTIVALTANDYIEMRAYQNSTTTLAVFLEADLGPDMWAWFLGP
jgi:hypothetical protein